jgi:hypothetical protein
MFVIFGILGRQMVFISMGRQESTDVYTNLDELLNLFEALLQWQRLVGTVWKN